MKTNMGAVDRAIRLVLVSVIAILYFTNNISGLAAIVFVAFAIIFTFTSFTGFCPLYYPFKITTNKKEELNK